MDIVMILLIIIVFGALGSIGYILYKDSKKKKNNNNNKNSKEGKQKGKDEKNQINLNDTEDLLEFESIKVCNDNHALIECVNKKYVGIIQVSGINFNLLSTDERIMLEENFGELLNGIDFPIQFYIQSRKIDLDNYSYKYEERLKVLEKDINGLVDKISPGVNNKKLAEEIEKKKSQLRYGVKLHQYFIDRTVNSDLLERKYYIVIKYNHIKSNYENELDEYEIISAAYSDIMNKANLIIDSLVRNNLKAKVLDGMEVGELLYTSYNKDDSALLKFKGAVESRYNHLCTTAKPIELKLLEQEIDELKGDESSILNEISCIEKEYKNVEIEEKKGR